jgi:hypothetical protein
MAVDVCTCRSLYKFFDVCTPLWHPEELYDTGNEGDSRILSGGGVDGVGIRRRARQERRLVLARHHHVRHLRARAVALLRVGLWNILHARRGRIVWRELPRWLLAPFHVRPRSPDAPPVVEVLHADPEQDEREDPGAQHDQKEHVDGHRSRRA